MGFWLLLSVATLGCRTYRVPVDARAGEGSGDSGERSDTADSGTADDTGDPADTGDPGDTGTPTPDWDCPTVELVKADAGPNLLWSGGAVSLDASASTGPGTLSAAWRVTMQTDSGEQTVDLAGTTASFTPPEGLESAVVRLTVSSGSDSAKDFLVIRTDSETPRVEAADLPPAMLGDTLTFSASNAETEKLIEAPEGSTASGSSFVADLPGIYAVRFENSAGDKAIARVQVSAPVLAPDDYAQVGSYQLSARGFEGFEAADSVRWVQESGVPELALESNSAACPTLSVSEAGAYSFKVVFKDAAGAVLSRHYPEYVWVDGPELHQAADAHTETPGIGALWVGSDSAAWRDDDWVVWRGALPLDGGWEALSFPEKATLVLPIERDSGTVWLLGHEDEGLRLYDGSGSSSLSSPMGWSDWGAVDQGLEEVEGSVLLWGSSLLDPLTDTELATLNWVDGDGDRVGIDGRGMKLADYDGDGQVEMALVHQEHAWPNSGCTDVSYRVSLLEGPFTGSIDADDDITRFSRAHCYAAVPALAKGDLDGDGYPDLVYGRSEADHAAVIALGGNTPDWDYRSLVRIYAPTDNSGDPLALQDDRLSLSGAGLGQGENWVLPLPLTTTLTYTDLSRSDATLLVGTSEDRLSAGRLADIDVDGDAELVGFGTDQLWWLEL